MRVFLRSLCFSLLLAASAAAGCHAQPPAGNGLTPELARRVEILIRSRTKLPPDYTMTLGTRTASEIPGYNTIPVTFKAADGSSSTLPFLLSTDGKTVAQFNKYDISKDPKTLVSDLGRPARGGPESAPVHIVVFDDLECPFCARMTAALFPALLDRYGSSVRVVYRDFPITQHPWAMRAAVDTNCLGAQNDSAYWKSVEYIHAHATDFGGTEHSLERANQQLDQLALDEAKKDGLKTTDVEACVKKQDQTAIKASLKLGEELGFEGTPILFINGERLEGAYPLPDVFRMVDEALTAEGKTPPPPYIAPRAPSPLLPPDTGKGAGGQQ